MKKLCCAILLVGVVFLGCKAQGGDEYNDLTLVPRMQKLTRIVDSFVRYDKPDASMSSAEIIEKATEHDRGVLAPFSGMHLDVRREGDNVVLLLCNPQRTVALMEDSGCTAKVDKSHIGSTMPSCAFTLAPAELCE